MNLIKENYVVHTKGKWKHSIESERMMTQNSDTFFGSKYYTGIFFGGMYNFTKYLSSTLLQISTVTTCKKENNKENRIMFVYMCNFFFIQFSEIFHIANKKVEFHIFLVGT